jgi:hypothetical protein
VLVGQTRWRLCRLFGHVWPIVRDSDSLDRHHQTTITLLLFRIAVGPHRSTGFITMRGIKIIMTYWLLHWPHLWYKALVSQNQQELDFVGVWSVILVSKSAIVWHLGVKFPRSSKYW